MKRWMMVGVAAALIAGACSSTTSGTTTTQAQPSTTAAMVTTTMVTPTTTTTTLAEALSLQTAQPRRVDPFAEFTAVPLLDDSVAYAGPATPTTLDDVLVAGALRPALQEPGVAATLAANGFVIVPGFDRLFHTAYEGNTYESYPLFVTTDVAYHTWHLIFSKVLREAEQQAMLPILEDLVLGLLDAAEIQEAELASGPLADHAARVREWLQAAATLLGLDVGPIGARAEAEVARALDAAELATSPVTSFGECVPTVSPAGCVDYTLFRPRGHYNRSEDLQRYFRTMSLLGQSGFFLDQPDSLMLGVLVARLLDGDAALTEEWRQIYEPTAFLVGLADDYTPFELAAVAAEVTPDGVNVPIELSDPAALRDLAQRLLASRNVGINPEAASVRVMGARFVVDSYILDQLTWPNVGEEPPELRRAKPSPLDVAASFGSEYAYAIQDAAGETDYLHYDEQLDAMQALIAGRTASDWAGTVYDAWMYALAPMWAPHGPAFPDFMQAEAWDAKSHQTGFGSYTELKHDTILYAKQGFAAEGGGSPETFEPRHWVEPDPVAFRRIAAVAAMTQDGLQSRDLLPAELDVLITNYLSFVERLAAIAGDELAGRPISEADNSWLERIGPELEALWLESSDIDESTGLPSSEDQDAAIVADIFRSTFDVLELGTGRIDTIFVLVPNDEGRFQVAEGGVYTYYEFWRPADEGRLTDEEWRELLDSGQAPDRPAWQAAFLSSAVDGGSGVGLPAPRGTLHYFESGLFCRDIAANGYGFDDALRYWWWDGSPERMDADGNGVPCETVYAAVEVANFYDDYAVTDTTFAGVARGAFCRDLDAEGLDYLGAFMYWLWDGSPERMDADRNGIPCETVYPETDVTTVLANVVGYWVE